MGHRLRRLGEMADGAFAQMAVFPLPAEEFESVIGLNGGGNGVGTIVAGRAANH